ncbi:MAG: hypothetical protein OES26_23040, partial [Gammaproteobacteria bacterium]|nr:hypothetical protein [Gammaproteobacteria bacterium]
ITYIPVGNATASLLSLITYIPVGNATASLLSLITYIPVGSSSSRAITDILRLNLDHCEAQLDSPGITQRFLTYVPGCSAGRPRAAA